ncbi:MAG: SusC/RagA family TonB-linked outer membrane protein [Paludibacteraceae bacterium]|nr:SusC/RagA family TonB-linked outer membrane protein [Paludibacteraceae bacterium]
MKINLKLISIFSFFSFIAATLSAQTDENIIPQDSVVVTPPTDRQLSERGHMTNSIEALSGTVAGVTIGNSANSQAMLSSVRVRGNNSLTGNNSPLVIIDGVASDLQTLSTIYPADIAAFNVLKDAAQTASYGSRGAAGVIEVTTVKGKTGKFNISYSGDVGVVNPSKTLSMLNADEYRNANTIRGLSFVDKGYNTDFQKAILRNAFVQNHHVAFGGGVKQTSYRASLSFSQNNSIVKTIGNQNFSTKLDVTQSLFQDRLHIDLGIFGSSRSDRFINDEQKLFYSAAAFNPTFPQGRNASGTWDGYADASQINNPESLLDIKRHDNEIYFNTHLKLSAQLGAGFSLTAFGSYSFTSSEQSYFWPTYLESTGKIYRGAGKKNDALGNLALNYTHDFSGHQINLSLLGELQQTTQNHFHTTVNQLATNAFGYDNLSVGAMRLWEGTGSFYERIRLVSFMAKAEYTALNRYNIAVTARADASSAAGDKNKWGVFPSVSLAWLMHNEEFLKHVSWLNTLKLHASYGWTGNIGGISAYQSMLLMAPSGITNNNGLPAVTLSYLRNTNPDLRWEVKKTVDVGLDMAFWNNRVVMNIDYYYSRIDDMLYNYTVSVPPFIYNTLLANLGSMQNMGLEIGVGFAAVKKKDFDFNINLNLTYQQNKLLSLNGFIDGQYLSAPQYQPIAGVSGAGLHGGNTDVVYQIVGQPLGVFYLPHCIGLKTEEDGTKTYIIEDVDNDGVISLADGHDRKVVGQATPKWLLGSNFAFRYKNLYLTLQLNGAFGHKIYNGTALSYMNTGSLPYYNISKNALKENINDLTVTDYWLEKGDYVNIDYITIGYQLPTKTNWPLQAWRVSFSVNNVATFSPYSGLTPMINNSVVNSTLGVDDKRSFPVAQTYSLALSFQF